MDSSEQNVSVQPEQVAAPQQPIVPAVIETSTPFHKKYRTLIAGFLGFFVAIGAYLVYTYWYTPNAPVAIVNGQKISAADFNETVALIKESMALQGVDTTTDATAAQAKEEALTILINNALLITGAEAAGITIDAGAFDETYSELIAQMGGEDALKEQMAAVGLTEEKLRRNIEERLLIERYLESATDVETVTATEEEVMAFVASLGDTEGLPPLAEIRPQIEAQIVGQKQQELIAGFIEGLRARADIETKI